MNIVRAVKDNNLPIIDSDSRALKLIEHEKSLIFFNGYDYEDPSIEELKKMKKLIESTIKNYNSISSSIKRTNDHLYEKYFPTTRREYAEQPRKIKKGIIYIVKCERTKLYKIGLTAGKIESRLRTLKTSNPRISLFKHYEGIIDVYNQEKKLHDLFSKKRIDGEWFELDELDLCNIDWFFNIPF